MNNRLARKELKNQKKSPTPSIFEITICRMMKTLNCALELIQLFEMPLIKEYHHHFPFN